MSQEATQADKTNNLTAEEARAAVKESCREVAQQILGLLPTIEEGLETMSAELRELKVESAVLLLQDVAQAVQSISKSLPTALFESPDIDKLTSPTTDIRQSIISFVDKHETNDAAAIDSYLITEVLPAFKAFRQKVEVVLTPLA